MEIKELDFSEFHPLDHRPYTKRCRGLYGGGRHHVDLAWEYKWKGVLRRWTLCMVGRHQWVTWGAMGREATVVACLHCVRERTP